MPPKNSVVRARDQARPSFLRSILAFGAAALTANAVSSVKPNIVTYDGDANGADTLPTKVDFYDRTGWPDVVFSATDNETSWAVSAGFLVPLNEGLIPQTLSNFATGSPNPCTVNRKAYTAGSPRRPA
jgi:hypothetical protein